MMKVICLVLASNGEFKKNPRSRLLSLDPCASINNCVENGSVPEWLMGADCKFAGYRLRWFKSNPAHYPRPCSSAVEHTLGKGEVTSSSLVTGLQKLVGKSFVKLSSDRGNMEVYRARLALGLVVEFPLISLNH